MLARYYHPDDVKSGGLDRLLDSPREGFDVRLPCDRIVVAGPIGSPIGCLVWRPGGVVHELRSGEGMSARLIADSLVNFAIADSLARPFNLHEAVFLTDSKQFSQYALSLHAHEEIGRRLFRLRLRQ